MINKISRDGLAVSGTWELFVKFKKGEFDWRLTYKNLKMKTCNLLDDDATL